MIPKVDVLLRDENIRRLIQTYGREAAVETLQEILARVREEAGRLTEEKSMEAGAEKIRRSTAQIAKEAGARLQVLFGPGIIPVVNGTGTILHTGLGRAPLGEKAAGRGCVAAQTYASLEYDLKTGERGERCFRTERLLCRLTGAEAAFAVNNNAAAVLLILSALAKGGEAVVSRGELVEIGGKFRIPDVMELSGAKLRETGTTNRTRLSDYEAAVNEETKVLLKVHTSNYRIVGFTESVSLEELCGLGRRKGICVVQDLGSGVLVDLSKYGLLSEPVVSKSISAGADIVCFSGDKLLGGPQAGIIVGRKCFLDRIKRHPLSRALRIDKFTAAALEQVLTEYLNPGQAVKNIPVLRMLTRPADAVKEDAEALAEKIRYKADQKNGIPAQITIEACTSRAGGGALPQEEIESFAVCIRPEGISAAELQRRLRELPYPVLGRICRDRFLLDMRTVDAKDADYLAELFSDKEQFSSGSRAAGRKTAGEEKSCRKKENRL